MTGAASLLRRELLDLALPFPPGSTAEHYHDHWLALCALALGEIAYLDRPTYDYTRHEESVTLSTDRPWFAPPRNARERLGIGWKPAPEREQGLLNAVASAIRYATNDLHAHVRLLPLWPGRDDEMLVKAREEAFRIGADPSLVTIVLEHSTPAEVASEIARADILLSMRLHALIFAAKSGVPAIALLYARKMRGQMRALGMERWVIEVDARTPPPEEMTIKLSSLWALREATGRTFASAACHAIRVAEADADAIARVVRMRPTPGKKS